jgi:hypothetical protein
MWDGSERIVERLSILVARSTGMELAGNGQRDVFGQPISLSFAVVADASIFVRSLSRLSPLLEERSDRTNRQWDPAPA